MGRFLLAVLAIGGVVIGGLVVHDRSGVESSTWYGVLAYCDASYEKGLFDGDREGREEGREEGRNEVCSQIQSLSRDLHSQLNSRGIC